MKKYIIFAAAAALLITSVNLSAQVLSESAKRKFTVGVDFYTDLWQTKFVNQGVKTRTINQGADVFFMYNFELGESLSSFSVGLGISSHNMYTNAIVEDVKADTIVFSLIEQNYKRSKINPTYIYAPLEFKFRAKTGFKFTVGMKVGYLIDSKQLYVGDRPEDSKGVKVKMKRIYQMEKFTFGISARVGYKWVSLYGYYQITELFRTGRGPAIYPISLGITITPF